MVILDVKYSYAPDKAMKCMVLVFHYNNYEIWNVQN